MKQFLLLTVFLLVASVAAQAQTDTVQFHTSARCGMCKDRLEEKMLFNTGVKKVELDLKTKVLTVWYNPRKTNPEALAKGVNRIGYDADAYPADEAAHAALPKCCQKDAEAHE